MCQARPLGLGLVAGLYPPGQAWDGVECVPRLPLEPEFPRARVLSHLPPRKDACHIGVQ